MTSKLLMKVLALTAFTGQAHAVEMKLYETGPAQDSSFVRFINGTTAPMTVTAKGSKAQLALGSSTPTTLFFPIRASTALEGTLTQGQQARSVAIKVEPGEFASVVAVPGKDGFELNTLREQPDDFNASKASLALYQASGACNNARLQVAGGKVALFENVAPSTVVRRQINPIAVSVELVCDGQPTSVPLDLGTLGAGQRYSLVAVPADKGTRLFKVVDTVAN